VSSVKEIIKQAEQIEEDWAGERREYIRSKALQLAMDAADAIILEASDGSVEETNYLTSEIATRFAKKVNSALWSGLMKKELLERQKS
jgi:hypothetical protein